MNEANIYKDAVAKWGIQAQLDQLQEECAEAIHKVSKVRRASAISEQATSIAFTALAEEIADVEIMCAQARLIVGTKFVDASKRFKLKRLKDRLKNSV